MDLRDLKYVLTLAEEKSFSRAAKKLFITQPSLSQFINRVEKDLGILIFNRSRKPLSLTEAGVRYVAYATQILGLNDEMRQNLRDNRAVGGRLFLGVPHFRSAYLLPRLVPFFRRGNPDIIITLMEGDTNYLERLLMEGAVDLAIMSLPIRERELQCRVIYNERILLAAPPHRAASLCTTEREGLARPLIDVASLRDENFIFTKPGSRFRSIVESICIDHGVNPRVVIETENLDTAQGLVAVGDEFTFVPEMYARDASRHDAPVYYSLRDPDYLWPMVIARKGNTLSNAAQAFFDYVLSFAPALLEHKDAGQAGAAKHNGA